MAGPRRRGQYPAFLTQQAWSIKDLLYGIKHQNMINFPRRTKPISRLGKIAPSCALGQQITARDLVHLPRSRSQSYNKVFVKEVQVCVLFNAMFMSLRSFRSKPVGSECCSVCTGSVLRVSTGDTLCSVHNFNN